MLGKIGFRLRQGRLYLRLKQLLGITASFFVLPILWLLSPIVTIKIGELITSRVGHLALNPDLFCRRRQIYGASKRTCYIFLANKPCNRQLLTMWKRHLPIIENRLLYALLHYSGRLWAKTRFYEPLEMKHCEYFEFQQGQPTLKFTPEEKSRGQGELRKMGLSAKDWFVIIYARDPLYLKTVIPENDWSYHDYRNMDINTFRLAIDYIIQKGGFVIRIGHHVMQTLNYHHPRVIDYATTCRTDFMDIYLSAECRFCVGSSGGATDISMIFDRPRVAISVAPPFNAPWSKNAIYIPKKIKNKKTDEYVPFGKFAQETQGREKTVWFLDQAFQENGYQYEDNTEQEILAATREMYEKLEGTRVTTEEDSELLEAYYSLLPKDHWASQIKTPIGQDFLRENRQLIT